jgi:ubiquitin-conjugating enzyme E2 S
LLIVPNPESALNEEAGKLLLEDYDNYCKHAKLMTSIHAKTKVDFGQDSHEKEKPGVLTPAKGNLSPLKRAVEENEKMPSSGANPVKKQSTATKKSLKRL